MTENQTKLTKEQIENYRKVLLRSLGPYALLISDEDVLLHRDNMQARINENLEARTPHFRQELNHTKKPK